MVWLSKVDNFLQCTFTRDSSVQLVAETYLRTNPANRCCTLNSCQDNALLRGHQFTGCSDLSSSEQFPSSISKIDMDTEQGERKKYLPSNSQVETASFQCISLHHIVQNPAQFGHLQRFQVYPSICSERKKTLSSKDCSNKTLHLKLEVSPNSSAKLSQSTVGTHPHSQMD